MNNKNKGFTLVETLAVLVILAIMAIVAVPTMTGFIENARKKTYIAEASTVCTAVQVYITEQYAMNGSVDFFEIADQVTAWELGAEDNALNEYLEGSYTQGGKITEFYADDSYVPFKFKGITYLVAGYKVEIRLGETVKVTKASEKE